MAEIFKPGSGLLFMKVGVHANESLEEIIARKSKEIEDQGFAMWGYGGNTCHPSTMVQPFVRDFVQQGQTINLCMQEMESKHFAAPIRAEEYSEDGLGWQEIPSRINVLGSRYALVIKGLRPEKFILPLDHTEVAIGNSRGRAGNKYVAGRVDKACLVVNHAVEAEAQEAGGAQISLVAELVEPYAVFLRNRPK